MKRNILFGTIALLAGSALAADLKDTVTAAAKKLADGGNYSWKQTVENAEGGGFGGGPTEGKTQDGLVWTSTEFNGNAIERVSKGTNSITKNQEGKWVTPEEMAAARGDGGGGGFGGGRRGFGRGGFFGANAVLPAERAIELVGLAQNLKEENGVISGDLTEAGAKQQLTFGRGRRGGGGGGGGGFTPPEPTNAKGSVKFWVKDGVLTKYELKNSGTMNFNDNEFQIDRTTTVEFNNVGNTKIDLPEEAKKKLS